MDKNTEQDYRDSEQLREYIIELFSSRYTFADIIYHLRRRSLISADQACSAYETIMDLHGTNIQKDAVKEEYAIEHFLDLGVGGLITWIKPEDKQKIRDEFKRLREC